MMKAFREIMIEGAGIRILMCAYIITSLIVGMITALYFGIKAKNEYAFYKWNKEQEEKDKEYEKNYE